MPDYRSRNLYYLKISRSHVLPLYLYIDERHLDWMNETVMQHLLRDLRPLILPKLKAEAGLHLGPSSSKQRGSVDAFKGESYQCAFFFTKTEPHSVLIKTRSFVAGQPVPRPLVVTKKRKAQESQDSAGSSRKKPKNKGKGKAIAVDSDEESGENFEAKSTSLPSTRSTRSKGKVAVGVSVVPNKEPPDEDVEMTGPQDQPEPIDVDTEPTAPVQIKDEDYEPELPSVPVIEQNIPPSFDIEIEELGEECKPKPVLQLRYQGFAIYGHCLCVVVEPWPALRSASRVPSRAPSAVPELHASRADSIAPTDFVASTENARRKTPLFLPDYDHGRSVTPAPFGSAFDGLTELEPYEDEGEEDQGGFMAFSQALSAVGDFKAGAAEEDDEMEGSIFFGDADATREL